MSLNQIIAVTDVLGYLTNHRALAIDHLFSNATSKYKKELMELNNWNFWTSLDVNNKYMLIGIAENFNTE